MLNWITQKNDDTLLFWDEADVELDGETDALALADDDTEDEADVVPLGEELELVLGLVEDDPDPDDENNKSWSINDTRVGGEVKYKSQAWIIIAKVKQKFHIHRNIGHKRIIMVVKYYFNWYHI